MFTPGSPLLRYYVFLPIHHNPLLIPIPFRIISPVGIPSDPAQFQLIPIHVPIHIPIHIPTHSLAYPIHAPLYMFTVPLPDLPCPPPDGQHAKIGMRDLLTLRYTLHYTLRTTHRLGAMCLVGMVGEGFDTNRACQ
jgi:hypothetical protein